MGSSKPTATRLRTIEVQGFQPKTLYRLSAPHGGFVLVWSSTADAVVPRAGVFAAKADVNGEQGEFLCCVYDTEDHGALLRSLGGYVIESEPAHVDEIGGES